MVGMLDDADWPAAAEAMRNCAWVERRAGAAAGFLTPAPVFLDLLPPAADLLGGVGAVVGAGQALARVDTILVVVLLLLGIESLYRGF